MQPTVLGMASTDEETGFIKGTKDEDKLNPANDPELEANGGPYKSKKAILQVTWRFPINWSDPLNIITLVYGYLPFVIPLVFFIDVVVERRFIAFYGLAVSAVVTVLNEVVLKPIVKDPRPEGSANRKYNEITKKWEMKPGMPSGHVLNATTTMVWCLLEVALRGPGFDVQPFLTVNILLLILVCMAPVPWARIYNKDHSLAQCTVAGAIGVVAGVVAYWIREQYFPLNVDKVWCASESWCLVSGKPWDPFLPEGDSLVAATAASGVSSALTTTKEMISQFAKIAGGDKLKVAEEADADTPKEAESESEETEEKVPADQAAADGEKRLLRGPEFKDRATS